MTTTTSYGTWTNVISLSVGVAQYVEEALGDYANEYDLEGLEQDFREEVGKLLPDGVNLVGDEFIGPYYERPDFNREELREKIEGVDLMGLAARMKKTFWSLETDASYDTVETIVREAFPGEPTPSMSKAGRLNLTLTFEDLWESQQWREALESRGHTVW